MNALEQILGAQHQKIKQRAEAAKQHPQHQVQPQSVHRGIAQLAHLYNCRLAVKNAKHNARHDHAGKYRFNGDQVVAELRAHLFDDKQDTSQRRVKSR